MEQNMDISDKDIRRIISLYESTLEIPENKPKNQFILCPIGIVGAGKTTVIKPLSKKLSLLRISSDEIREILKKNGFDYSRTKEIAYAIIKKYIKQGFSIAIDGDCVSEDNQNRIKELEKEYSSIKVFWIHINPPEEFIINKLKKIKHSWLFRC
jgi:shikimate kinase